MSEKLYDKIQTVDIYQIDSPSPHHKLIFSGPNTYQEESFPENRDTLFFEGNLYDWNGRMVMLGSKQIANVVDHFGYVRMMDIPPHGYITDKPLERPESIIKDTFLVRLKNGNLALAVMFPISEDKGNPFYARERQEFRPRNALYLGWPLHYEFEGFAEIDITKTCLYEYYFRYKCYFDDNPRKYWHMSSRKFKIITGVRKDMPSVMSELFNKVQDDDLAKFGPYKAIAFAKIFSNENHVDICKNQRTDCFMAHHIFKDNRAVIMKTKSWKTLLSKEHESTPYIFGSIKASKNGQVLTSYAYTPDANGNHRISTDANFIAHVQRTLFSKDPKNYIDFIPWYYDPES